MIFLRTHMCGCGARVNSHLNMKTGRAIYGGRNGGDSLLPCTGHLDMQHSLPQTPDPDSFTHQLITARVSPNPDDGDQILR